MRADPLVDGEMKNLIFAADGPKPRIVLADAVSNTIDIVEGADRCLVYDRTLSPIGLTWGELLANRRLVKSLVGDEEKLLSRTYRERYAREDAESAPALVLQVYLHYDPYTAAHSGHRRPRTRAAAHGLLLLPDDQRRIVIEVDGRHHYTENAYTDDERPSPRLYSEMVAEDRRIRVDGYEVFRFGGYELSQSTAPDMVRSFFADLIG